MKEHKIMIRYFQEGKVHSVTIDSERDLLEKVLEHDIHPEDVVEYSCSCSPGVVIKGNDARGSISLLILKVIADINGKDSHDSPLQ